ncbi:aminoglycoside phosphotransferase family protein [Rossellomorea vietnamensis]|uniref:Aminoglycoside phosphotransferase family protein n=1 Tax=Rossellomorea vietnamensis TaxID=218284 RepID=A0A5D4NIT9_9BACI|nr:aminoglycoside phosphotransferase family protein [Rossellomorea vietnamensis]TYS14153.1 aminoglycoside phosphotransferase family protein [Rossellomorea vietnamensis]
MKVNQLIDIIKRTNPDIQINEIQTNTNGWDNDILILNNKVVFRFPKSKEVAVKVKDEVSLINRLQLENPLVKLPKYESVYLDGEFKGVRYDYLEGDSLSDFEVINLIKPQNAEIIGDFLTKLHSINLSEFKGAKILPIHTKEYWEDLYNSVEALVFPCIKQSQKIEINNLFNDFFSNSNFSTTKKVLIHGDLTIANILFQKDKGLVSGIIDFTDAQAGDPAFDFAGLYWSLGPDFTAEVLSYYQVKDNGSIFNRVQSFYGLQPIFHNLLYAIKENHYVDWETALDRFSYLNSIRNEKFK